MRPARRDVPDPGSSGSSLPGRAADVLRGAIDAEAVAALVADVAELRGEHDLVTTPLDGLTDEALVGERAVHVGRVEEGDAKVERAMDRGDRLGVVAPRIEVGH